MQPGTCCSIRKRCCSIIRSELKKTQKGSTLTSKFAFFVVIFCCLVCLFFYGKKKVRTKTLATKATGFTLWMRQGIYLLYCCLKRLSKQALSILFYQIALICWSQATLRVECTLWTQTVKDPSMYIVTCALMVEDGPCFREDKMARRTSIAAGMITNRALVSWWLSSG